VARGRIRRGYNGSVTVDVDVDVNDVLVELDDDALLAECKAREIKAPIVADEHPDLLQDLLDLLRRGDCEEATLLLERTIHPKFGSLELCEKEFASLKASAVSDDRSQAKASEVVR
jgi:hypothetical protein